MACRCSYHEGYPDTNQVFPLTNRQGPRSLVGGRLLVSIGPSSDPATFWFRRCRSPRRNQFSDPHITNRRARFQKSNILYERLALIGQPANSLGLVSARMFWNALPARPTPKSQLNSGFCFSKNQAQGTSILQMARAPLATANIAESGDDPPKLHVRRVRRANTHLEVITHFLRPDLFPGLAARCNILYIT